MKAIFTQTSNSPLHAIDFSVELPLIIADCTKRSFGRGIVISRAQNLNRLVDEMVEINIGRFHQETINADPVYHDYLSDLLFTDGLEFVHRSGRYRM
ncbi:hypothetical protein [Allorhodopirellula heiligendammensis]|uniref:Uncharacterized protein n=1 Tax=Allorhodopirellula heiligendammensis TaxID=2714739 RepID=A0A5C6C3F1_9BACT|nr:hypothetical protein [Allorhodopirellula heiligendammensis]TWU18605.1 hypothetical protein Poly21_07690 [Allorhodopirellula heiligendammensis]